MEKLSLGLLMQVTFVPRCLEPVAAKQKSCNAGLIEVATL